MRRREAIPTPSDPSARPVVSPDALIATKAALYSAMHETRTSNVALAAKLSCAETEVRRMLDPRHATKIGRLEKALATFGRRVVITVDAA
jgi:antitoxin HicB